MNDLEALENVFMQRFCQETFQRSVYKKITSIDGDDDE